MLSRSQVLETLYNSAQSLIKADNLPTSRKVQGNPRAITFNGTELRELTGLSKVQVDGLLKELEDEGHFIMRNNSGHLSLDWETTVSLLEKTDVKTIKQLRSIQKKAGNSYKLPVTLVNISKGGVGKSTTAINLAVSSALDMSRQYRTVLIDTDPQGSILNQLGQSALDKFFDSYSKLIEEGCSMSRAERLSEEKQAYFRKYVLNLIQITHLDNLVVLPASFENSKIDTSIANCIASFGKDDALSVFQDVIINPISDDFDMVIIDSPPASNIAVAATYYAANHIIFVTTGREQDLRSYTKHKLYLIDVINRLLPSDWDGFESMNTVITRLIEGKSDIAKAMQYNVGLVEQYSSVMSTVRENKKYEEAAQERLPLQLLDSRNDKPYQNAMMDASNLYEKFSSRVTPSLF